MFLDVVKGYIGTPYSHQGRTPGLALDCAGVIECAAKDCGFDVVEYNRGYGRLPHKGQLAAAILRQSWIRQASEKWAAGNILLIRWKKEPQHLAVVTENETIIHAYQPSGRVVEVPLAEWKEKTVMQFEVIE